MTHSDERSKNFKLLNEGPLDSFWGPYDTAAMACAAVPSAVRSGKIVGVGTTTIAEYIWHPGDLTDTGLILMNIKIIISSVTAAFTNLTINTAYPTAQIGQEVACPNLADGPLIYKKITTTIWYSIPMGTI